MNILASPLAERNPVNGKQAENLFNTSLRSAFISTSLSPRSLSNSAKSPSLYFPRKILTIYKPDGLCFFSTSTINSTGK